MGIQTAVQSHQHTGRSWGKSNTNCKEQTMKNEAFDQG